MAPTARKTPLSSWPSSSADESCFEHYGLTESPGGFSLSEDGCRYRFRFGSKKGTLCNEAPVLPDGFCPLHSPNNEEWRQVKSLRRVLERHVARNQTLEGAQLAGVDLRLAHLAGAGLQGANLQDALFYRARMPRCDFTGANLRGTEFSGANLRQANFSGVEADEAQFQDANLTGAGFKGAGLIRANFEQAIGTGTNFSEALLLFANFFDASLEGTNFTLANLSRANFESAHLFKVRFHKANLENISFNALTVLRDVYHLESARGVPSQWLDFLRRQKAFEDKEGGAIPAETAQSSARVQATEARRPVTHLLPGDHFGEGRRFKILRKLGKGGMALVYLVKDRGDSRNPIKAVKVLDPGLRAQEMNVQRFRQEGKLIQTLRHPKIIHIHAVKYAREYDTFYLVMEYVDGTDLERLCYRFAQRRQTLLDPLGANIVLQICEGLEFTHQHNIIHRDLKPGNVLMRKNREVVLSDFGLCKTTESIETTLHLSTLPGTIMGTFDYMAPEQLVGEKITAASDIYALGVIMYEMFTGHRPYSAESIDEWINVIVHVSPTPARVVNPKVPLWLSEIIQRCLAKDPDNRLQNIGALKKALFAKRLG
jgi:uncharacterized protein YjbI with pentapeptide repeats/tRNA A-37 threonylcarbamoyl transferase component Bud32